MHLVWSHTNYGKGVFRCGANTHKDPIYQKRVCVAFSKALVDYIDDEAIATSLRQLIGQIEDSERTREEYLTLNNDNFKFPSLLDENLAHIDAQLQNLYYLLPTNNEIVCDLISKDYAKALTFLLSKAEGITRTFNKKKDWSRVQTRQSILDELNKAHNNPDCTQTDIDAIELRLKDFDDLAVKDILEKHKVYRLLEDERPSKRFLSCENKRAAYNNVSRLQRTFEEVESY